MPDLGRKCEDVTDSLDLELYPVGAVRDAEKLDAKQCRKSLEPGTVIGRKSDGFFVVNYGGHERTEASGGERFGLTGQRSGH